MTARIFSFYLPQFHSIPENDEWHGQGFTEWTKVKAARPLFDGHIQPVTPHQSIGYYTLSETKILEHQAQLMKRFGVDGQIFYHYWFGGRQILEKPAEMLLEDKSIDMPFAFCWANENWTKRWDGGSGEVLLAQNYSEIDAKEFIKYLLPFFRDDRYLTVHGRPLLIIYRTADIKQLSLYLKTWSEICLDNGLPEPYVISVQTLADPNAAQAGVLGEIERPLYNFPELTHLEEHKEDLGAKSFRGYIWKYQDVMRHYLKTNKQAELPTFPTVLAGWDVSPRHGGRANILIDWSSEIFEEWLEAAIDLVQDTRPEDEQLVFINAWNEWAEGAFLEPDELHGFAKLEALRKATRKMKYK